MNDDNGALATATIGGTGEVVEVAIDIDALAAAIKAREEPKKRKPPKPKSESGFIMVWLDELLATYFTMNQMHTMMHLTNQMDRFGHVRFQLAEIARVLGVTSQSAWRIIDGLVDRDGLHRVERGHFIVNPTLMWRGSLADRAVAMIRWRNKDSLNITIEGTEDPEELARRISEKMTEADL